MDAMQLFGLMTVMVGVGAGMIIGSLMNKLYALMIGSLLVDLICLYSLIIFARAVPLEPNLFFRFVVPLFITVILSTIAVVVTCKKIWSSTHTSNRQLP